MADFSTLIATLQATIKTNYNQEITGQILQDDLLAIVDAVNRLKQDTLEGYAFYGEPLTDGASIPVTQNTFFLVGPGTYTINGSTNTISDAGISVIVYDSVNDEITIYPLFVYDTTPTEDSLNPVTSGGIFDAIERAVDGLANIIGTKQPKDTDAVAGNVAVMDAGGSSVDGGVALADLATKAEVEAVEQQVAQVAGEAGLAEAVIDTDGAGTGQEFTFRKSGGDGGAYYRKIKGKTLAWNQQSGDNTPINLVRDTQRAGNAVVNSVIEGHKYYCSFNLSNTVNDSSYSLGVKVGDGSNDDNIIISNGRKSFIQTVQSRNSDSIYFFISSAAASNTACTINNINLIDLTLLGLENLTASQFEALYPDAYYPYNPGTLISNDADAVETTGANQWDEEWEVGRYNNSGEKVADATRIRSKNKIKVIAEQTYYVTGPISSSADFNYVVFNASGNAIGNIRFIGAAGTVTMPSGADSIVFYLGAGYGTTYNHDICINLSNPAINGQYFPFWKRTLQLGLTTKEDTDGNVPFADGMKGAGTDADWCDKKGGEKRVKRVVIDLNALTGWEAWLGGYYCSDVLPEPSAPTHNPHCVCDKLLGTGSADAAQGSMSVGVHGNALYISADVYNLSTKPVITLDYELATPVPFTWAEPLNLGVKVDENGTERAVAPEGATAPSAPFVADTTYTMSVARMVEILQNI